MTDMSIKRQNLSGTEAKKSLGFASLFEIFLDEIISKMVPQGPSHCGVHETTNKSHSRDYKIHAALVAIFDLTVNGESYHPRLGCENHNLE